MNISRAAIERLLKINWFMNIGKKTGVQNIRQVTNNSDFMTEITSVDWENTTLEAGNEITGYLAKKHTKIYQEWNVIVRQAKKVIDDELLPLLKDKAVSESVLIDNIKWDLVNFLMEDTYQKHLKGDLFFDSIIKVYELGHIPCGWDGKWPAGRLVIY